MRQVNPDDLEHLADLLDAKDGQSGVAWELQQLFNRASRLGAGSELNPLQELQTWASETAADLRHRAEIARRDGDEGTWSGIHNFVTTTMDAFLFSAAVRASFRNPWGITGGFLAPVGGFAINMAQLAVGAPTRGFSARSARDLARQLPNSAVRLLGGNPSALSQNLVSMGRGTYSTLRAAGGGVLSSLGGTARHIVVEAGLLRLGSIAGGIYGTGAGISDLISQGNPWHAFRNDPADYTADVTGTLFNASMTAALVAPTPLTAAIAAGTGAAYGAALIWDHWDTVTNVETYQNLAGTALDWTYDAADLLGNAAGDATDALGDAADAGRNFVDGAGDFLGDAGDAFTSIF